MSQPILINILPKFYNSYNYYYSTFTFYGLKLLKLDQIIERPSFDNVN